MVEGEERGFGGGVGGEVGGAEVAEHGGDGHDGAAAFGEHVREEGAEGGEVGEGVYAEGSGVDVSTVLGGLWGE